MNEPRVNLIVLRAADVERAAGFYRALGMTFTRHAHGSGPQHFAAEAGGIVFELYPATASQPVSSSARIGFVVDDVDACAASLAAIEGAKLITAPTASEWGRRAVVADPDGHRVELVGRA